MIPLVLSCPGAFASKVRSTPSIVRSLVGLHVTPLLTSQWHCESGLGLAWSPSELQNPISERVLSRSLVWDTADTVPDHTKEARLRELGPHIGQLSLFTTRQSGKQ